MRKYWDITLLFSFVLSLLINYLMIGWVAMNTRPRGRISIADPLIVLHTGHKPTTRPQEPEIVAAPEIDPQLAPRPRETSLADDLLAAKVELKPVAPPKVKLDQREEFGENNSTGEALNSSPGAQPLQGREGPQQPILNQNPAPVGANLPIVQVVPGGGENGGGQPVHIGSQTPAVAEAPRPKSPLPADPAKAKQPSPPEQVATAQKPAPVPPRNPPKAQPTPDAPVKPLPPVKPVDAKVGELAKGPQPNEIAKVDKPSPEKTSPLDGKGIASSNPLKPVPNGTELPHSPAAPAPHQLPEQIAAAEPNKVLVAAASPQPPAPPPAPPSPEKTPAPPAPPHDDLSTPIAPQDPTLRLLATPPDAPSNPSVKGNPGMPGPIGPTPTLAPPSDSDSDPFASDKAVVFVNGKVIARNGRWVKSVKPQLTQAGYIDASLLPDARVEFLATVDEQGNVIHVERFKSSGSDNIDLPCERALNEWKIEPSKDKYGHPVKDIVPVSFGIR